MRRSTRLLSTTASAFAILMSMPAAFAQTAPTTSDQPNSSAAIPSEPANTDIVVTGSRITGNLASASPIATVSAEQFKQTGAVTLEDTINRLPQIVPARGATSNDGLTGGITTLDLRGLGSNRTLVLQDSRRLPAATPLGSVDINIIPSALIESVDVVTGGASAAYGSDAIAGVINFKLNHRFTGLRLDAQTGVTERGDGFSAQASLTGGTSFGSERGHVVASISYAKRDGVANSARDFSGIVRPSSSLPTGAYIANSGNLPTQAAINSVFARYGVTAGAVGASRNIAFNSDGTLFGYQTNNVNFRDQGFGLINNGSSIRYNSSGVGGLTIPFERVGGYLHADYDVSDDTNVYVEGSYQHFTSSAYYAPGFRTVSVPISNPFIPADLAAILASRLSPTASFSVTRRFAEVGYRTADTENNTFQVRAGAKGAIGIGDLTWDVYGAYARSNQDRTDLNGFSISALSQLVNAADGGRSVCSGGLNLFGSQTNTACAAHIRRTNTETSLSTQGTAEATIQGSLFRLPAGAVRFAVGADYRADTFDYQPDAVLQSGDIVSFSSGGIPPVTGSVKAKEVYAELSVPLLADLPLIHRIDLNGGYRFSDYQRFGSVSSYRGEGSWEVVPGVKFRGSYARAVRAPSIQDSFAPTSLASPSIGNAGSAGQGDPCDVRGAYRNGANATAARQLCVAQGLPSAIADSYIYAQSQIVDGGIEGGNPSLKPETADTYSFGGTLAPKLSSPWLSRFSLSVDYYRIKIDGAVGTIDGAAAIQKCYNFDGSNPSYSSTNYYCGLFTRNANTGDIQGLQLTNLNLGEVKTSGIDIALNWQANLEAASFPGGGRFSVNAAATWLESYDVQNLPGEGATNYKGSIGYSDATAVKALPTWKAMVNASYSNGPITIGGQYRFIDRMLDVGSIGGDPSDAEYVPSRSYVDLFASIRATDRFEFRFGVNNLTDKQPPVFSSFDQSNTLPTTYDVPGRSFFAGVTANW